ncbi:MAG: hypothetical protein QXH02_06960 [Desulfurococcaceae archaeon]
MPKNPTEVLREELRKLNIELLDIYSFKDHDVIRAYNKQVGKVILYRSKRKVNAITSREEATNLALEIVKQV